MDNEEEADRGEMRGVIASQRNWRNGVGGQNGRGGEQATSPATPILPARAHATNGGGRTRREKER